MAFAHMFQWSQIDEAWSANMITIRMDIAIAHHVITKFTLGVFDAAISLACRYTNLPPFLSRKDLAARNLFQRLLQNLYRFAHLFDANHVTIVNITIIENHRVKIEAIVNRIRFGFA